MKSKKTIFIALGSIALVFTLLVISYVIRQKQFQALLDETTIMNNEDTGLASAEYGTVTENETADDKLADYITVDDDIADDKVTYNKTDEGGDGIGNVSELIVEPSAKLEDIYEEAMANSNLEEYEIELIRAIVGNENKTFEEALQTVRPGSRVVYEQTETKTVSNNQNSQEPTTPKQSTDNSKTQSPQEPTTPKQSTDNNSNTQKTTKPSVNNKKSFEKKKAALLEGIEELKVKFPGYDEEWDIVAKEFYTDEEILTQNPLDQLCVLDMYAEQRDGIPPMKFMREHEMCEWKHMPTFTADMEEHDPEGCCICRPELAGEGEHEIQYNEQWSVY